MNVDDLHIGTRVRVRRDGGPLGGVQRARAGRRGVVLELVWAGSRTPLVRVRFDRYGEPPVLFSAEELEPDPDVRGGAAS